MHSQPPFGGRCARAALLGLVVLGITAVSCRRAETPPPESAAVTSANQKLQATEAGPVWFEDLTGTTGLTFTHSSGHRTRHWMPEIESGGVGLLDYDGDGLLDVFCVNGGDLNQPQSISGHKLYRNLGGFRFQDVTEAAGVGGRADYGMGVACADYDNDGDMDLLVTHVGGCLLYQNQGNGRFKDVTTASGLGLKAWGTSAAFVDLDGDGFLDLYVANYLNWSQATELDCRSRGGEPDYCSPLNYKAAAVDSLFRNRGDGTFESLGERVGLPVGDGHGLGVATGDFDRDGWTDIYVANDATPNALWLNRGPWTFQNEAMLRGCALNLHGIPRAGMGVVAVDLGQRGWLDLFITHLVNEGNGFFENQGGNFTDVLLPNGPTQGSLPFTGFGVGFHDFNNDGHLDLYIANGRVRLGAVDLDPGDPYAEPNTLMRGLGGRRFEHVSPAGGVSKGREFASRAVAFGDLDNDGSLDAVVVNKDGPVHLLRNRIGGRAKSVRLRVLRTSGTVAFNAMVRLEAGGQTQWRQVSPNEGYCASHDPRVHFGLGTASRIDRICVRWPSGAAESFGPFESGAEVELREGKGTRGERLFDW